MSYIGYAILITIAVCCGIIALTKTNFGGWRQPLRLRVDYTDVFDDIFESYATKHQLFTVKTTNMVRYQVVLKDDKIQKNFIDALRCRNGNLTIVLNNSTTGNEEL